MEINTIGSRNNYTNMKVIGNVNWLVILIECGNKPDNGNVKTFVSSR